MKKISFVLFLVISIGGIYLYYYPKKEEVVVPVELSSKEEVFVDMRNFSFIPSDIVIDKGTKVTWINNDNVGHSIKSDPHPSHNLFPDMNSGDMAKGETFSFVFEKEGEYPYHCDPHSRGMIGKIIVK